MLLLNSDTRLFAGAIEELAAVAHGAPDIGTATALSNNATIFTYPATNAPDETIADVSWEELAGEALARHRGQTVDMPTAHGFCMLITRAMLDRVGGFDTAFGRGYGEENDFCQRGADLGFRHVAAIGVFVEHRERISFGAERDALLLTNLALLAGLYPEYDAVVAAHEARDPLRRARWALHRYRLAKARAAAPGRAVLVVGNQLGGGTARAEREIEAEIGYDGALRLRLSCTLLGVVELAVDTPAIIARIAPEDYGDLFDFLDTFGIDMVLVHHVLGYTPDFIAALTAFARGRQSVWYAHDFYPICPRVTLIDATGAYCGGPEAARCVRCFDLGGGHEASRTGALTPDEHRALFADLLGRMTQIVAPSEDAAAHLRAVLPDAPIMSIGHPHLGPPFPAAARDGTWTDIVLLGAIGPHKGSAELLALARRASLTHPELRFHVIGFTDIDTRLAELDNVTITGRYAAEDLAGLIAAAGARIALFLHIWPETFSYTLSEAVAHGLIPVVPDIGAPAERVRACGFGTVFPHPFDAGRVLDTLAGLAEGRVAFSVDGGTPARFDTPDAAGRIAAVFRGEEAGKKSRLRRLGARGRLNPSATVRAATDASASF